MLRCLTGRRMIAVPCGSWPALNGVLRESDIYPGFGPLSARLALYLIQRGLASLPVGDDLTRRDLGRVRHQLGEVLGIPFGLPLVRLLGAGLVLEHAHRDHHAATRVREVVGNEPPGALDQRHEALGGATPRLGGIRDALVPSHRCVHFSPSVEYQEGYCRADT